MNVRDSEVICGLLRTMNYELTTKPQEADIIILNTCSVRQHAENRVWNAIDKYSVTSRLSGWSDAWRRIIRNRFLKNLKKWIL